MDLFDIAIARKLSGGGGGGGSSDFSTAEVTIVGDGGLTGIPLPIAVIDNGNIIMGIIITEESPQTFTVPLYKSNAVLNILIGGTSVAETSGDVVFDEDTGSLTVSGNCSISLRVD